MGEAKRKKESGVLRNGGPVEDFRVPPGKLAITITIGDEPPSTVMFDSDRVAEIAARTQQEFSAAPYYSIVRGIIQVFTAQMRDGGDLSGAAFGFLWTALYHPMHGEQLRAGVSRKLRQTGRAHITWRATDAGLMIAMADQFVDIPVDALAARAPAGFTAVVLQPDDEPKPN